MQCARVVIVLVVVALAVAIAVDYDDDDYDGDHDYIAVGPSRGHRVSRWNPFDWRKNPCGPRSIGASVCPLL